MGTTARGITYPASTDNVRLWEWFQELAEDTDDALDDLAATFPASLSALWTLGSQSASSAIGASSTEQTTAAFQAPSSTYAAHTAYRISIRGLVRASTTSGNLSVRIRDTNAAGTTRFDNEPLIALTTGNSRFPAIDHIVANTTGAAITGRVLCLTFSHSAAGGALFNASALNPWSITCTPAGVDTTFPWAVAL